MKVEDIAYKGKSSIPGDEGETWYSKTDDSYLTRVGMEEDLKFLETYNITEQIQSATKGGKTSQIGFNVREQKWYGWSHRAIFGFGIGNKCTQGDCGFKASNKEEFVKSRLSFWGDSTYSVSEPSAEEVEGGVTISYKYNQDVPNEELRGTLYEHFCEFPKEWGKGEWTANTLEEAKEMAIDFAKGIS